MTIRVQKNIPMPEVKPRGMEGRTKPKYPWDIMEIGDSFAFPLGVGRNAYSLATQASRYQSPKEFKVAKVDAIYRCWRVA